MQRQFRFSIYGVAWVPRRVHKGRCEGLWWAEGVLRRESQGDEWRGPRRHYGGAQPSANDVRQAFARNHKSLDTQIWRYTVLTKHVTYISNQGIDKVLLVIPQRFLHKLWTVQAVERLTISSSSIAEEVWKWLKLCATAQIHTSKQANCSRYWRLVKEQPGEINSGRWYLLPLLQWTVSTL